jgi:hypothetical protein
MQEQSQPSTLKADEAKKVRVYSSQIGRPKEHPVVRAAEAAAARALVQMSRAGAGITFRRSEAKFVRDGLFRSRQRPIRKGDGDLAQLFLVGSDARGIWRFAAGKRSLTRDRGAHAVEKLIHHALLPRYATALVPLDEGHARLIAPFQPFFQRLQRVGSCRLPPTTLRQRLARFVRRYRSAVRDLAARECAERQAFQEARDEVIRALLLLRSRMRVLDDLTTDAEAFSLARCAALRAANLLSVVHTLNSLQVETRESPRESAAGWAKALLPAPAREGGPDFAELFNWLVLNLDPNDADLHSAIALRRELVGGSWWARLHASYANAAAPKSAEWKLVGLYAASPGDQVEMLVPDEPSEVIKPHSFSECQDDKELDAPAGGTTRSPVELLMDGAPIQDMRFARHLRRVVGEVKLRAMLLFAMTDRWYAGDVDAEESQTEFESDLFAVCMWVRSLYPGRTTLKFEQLLTDMGYPLGDPSKTSEVDPAFLKQLIYKLSRTLVRRPVEMNLDIPVVPGDRNGRVF